MFRLVCSGREFGSRMTLVIEVREQSQNPSFVTVNMLSTQSRTDNADMHLVRAIDKCPAVYADWKLFRLIATPVNKLIAGCEGLREKTLNPQASLVNMRISSTVWHAYIRKSVQQTIYRVRALLFTCNTTRLLGRRPCSR
jgi:hypothetical protein